MRILHLKSARHETFFCEKWSTNSFWRGESKKHTFVHRAGRDDLFDTLEAKDFSTKIGLPKLQGGNSLPGETDFVRKTFDFKINAP